VIATLTDPGLGALILAAVTAAVWHLTERSHRG